MFNYTFKYFDALNFSLQSRTYSFKSVSPIYCVKPYFYLFLFYFILSYFLFIYFIYLFIIIIFFCCGGDRKF